MLWGFPLTAPRVKYVSNYNFPLTNLSRTLTPIAGYDAGVYNFSAIVRDISDKISMGLYKYSGGVLGPDGKIVFVPMHADHIGIFDPSDRSFTAINVSNKISIDYKYHGGVLGPDGKIVFVPDNADDIGIFDPSDRSFTTIDITDKISIDYKYHGGVLGPDGKIVFVPYHADNIGVFDPSDRSFTTIDISDKISSDGKYWGGVLGPDGKIVFVPSLVENIGVFDPSDRSFTTIDIPQWTSDQIMYHVSRFHGGVLGPDGKIIFVPGSNSIGVFDPSDRSLTLIDIRHTDGYYRYFGGANPFYRGGVLGPDGKIVFVPLHANNIGILELGNQDLAYEISGGIPGDAWSALLSPHFNKC